VANKWGNPKHDHEAILFMLHQGRFTVAEVAERFGCSRQTVSRIKRKAGMITRKGPTQYTDEILARAKAMLEDRAGYRQAALTLGIDEHALARRFPGMGLTNEESRERAVWGHTFNNIRASL
jgi:transcriptional regulator with XRE-family HTH domain